MQLPRGTLEKSFRGPGTLASITEGITKDSLTGYLRVSILSDNATECVAVYLSGKPVMAFVSSGDDDRPDPGMAGITASIRQPGCIIEICKLTEKQVALLQELYDTFAYKEPLPPPKPAEKPAARPAPVAQASPRAAPQAPASAARPTAARFTKPEIRGRFVRSEELEDIREYIDRYPGDTGHLLFVVGHNGTQEEHHAIITGGRIEAVYDDKGIVPGVPGWLEGIAGVAEFYAVDSGVLAAVLQRSLKSIPGQATTEPARPVPAAATAVRPAIAAPAEPRKPPAEPARIETQSRQPAIGVSAKTILEKTRAPTEAAPVEDDISRTVDELSKSMDDDIAMVRKVEQDFALHADELLEKLDLGHLRRDRRK